MKSGMLIASMFLLACSSATGLAMAKPLIGPATLATAHSSNSIESIPAVNRTPLVWTEQRVTADDGFGGQCFGWSIAMDSTGTTALVSGPAINGLAMGFPVGGSVYVFTNSGGVWTQSQELTAGDGGPGDNFGYAVAISGTTAVVSSMPQDASGNWVGENAAYVFTVSGGMWVQQQKLTASDGVPEDSFGNTVAVDGSTILVGAYAATVGGNSAQGAVYVFSLQGGTWEQTQKLTAAEGAANDLFGNGVGIRNDVAVVGSLETVTGHSQTGAAYVFAQSGGVWTQVQKLNDPAPSNSASFGQAFALDDTTLLVGAIGQNVGGTMSGAVYVFAQAGGVWTQTQELSPNDGQLLGLFGISLGLDGGRALIGARQFNDIGKAYLFTADGGVWTQADQFSASDGHENDLFGMSVALRGNVALVGAPQNNFPGGAGYFITDSAAPPAADIAPGSLAFVLPPGGDGSSPLTIGNAGGSDLTWAIAEAATNAPAGSASPRSTAIAGSSHGESLRINVVALSGRVGPRDAAPWSPRSVDGGLSFLVDDGSYENALGLASGFPGIFINRFSPPAGTGAFTIDSISIMWPQDTVGSLVGEQVNLLAYYDADGDGDPGNALRLGGDDIVTIASVDSFIDYTVNFSVPGDGDIYVGFENIFASGGVLPAQHPAAMDQNGPLQQRSWIAAMGDSDPDADNLANNAIIGTTDSFGLPSNWLIRAIGTTGAVGGGCSDPSDVPWLTESPLNGSVTGGASQDVTVTADATGLSPGAYSAILCVTTNDPANSLIKIPVSLTVTDNNDDAVFQDGFDGTP